MTDAVKAKRDELALMFKVRQDLRFSLDREDPFKAGFDAGYSLAAEKTKSVAEEALPKLTKLDSLILSYEKFLARGEK